MCIIIYTPDGRIPKKHLQRSLAENPDGWGYMFAWEGEITIRKGLERNEFWAQWRADREFLEGRKVVFHSRITTHGGTTVDNCHPFEIPGHGLALAHNGIISHHAKKDSDLSDTRHFVQDLLADLPRGFLTHKGIRRLISEYIGWSKLAFLGVNGNVCLLNSYLGEWRAGRWYSNDSYRREKVKTWTFSTALGAQSASYAKVEVPAQPIQTPTQSAFAAALGGSAPDNVTLSAPTHAKPAWVNRLQNPFEE